MAIKNDIPECCKDCGEVVAKATPQGVWWGGHRCPKNPPPPGPGSFPRCSPWHSVNFVRSDGTVQTEWKPFEKASAIRKGECDNELPDYSEITGWLARVPRTWLPGLLRRVVYHCEQQGVFQDGGIEKLVAHVRKTASDPNSMLRSKE